LLIELGSVYVDIQKRVQCLDALCEWGKLILSIRGFGLLDNLSRYPHGACDQIVVFCQRKFTKRDDALFGRLSQLLDLDDQVVLHDAAKETQPLVQLELGRVFASKETFHQTWLASFLLQTKGPSNVVFFD